MRKVCFSLSEEMEEILFSKLDKQEVYYCPSTMDSIISTVDTIIMQTCSMFVPWAPLNDVLYFKIYSTNVAINK